MPLHTQYNIVTCAEPTWKAYELAARPLLIEVLEAFELSDFTSKSIYRFVNFFIEVDGYTPGKEDTVFQDQPDIHYIHYSERRTDDGKSLCVGIKVKREEWVDLDNLGRIEHLFFCKLYLASVHVCRHLKLNYRGLTKMMEGLAELDRNKIALEIQNLSYLTYNKQPDKQKNELEVEFEMTAATSYQLDPRESWKLEDAIDEVLQNSRLGYVDGHDIVANLFTIHCHCFAAPQKVLNVIKALPIINSWGSIHATLITHKSIDKIQVR